MNEAAYKKLSILLQKYCPDFLADKYPGFISFLKAYYDWSYSTQGFNPWRVVSHIIEWGDIDETLDQFIMYFKNEYLNGLNTEFNADIPEFIKHSKEFYASRGTPESFRFLLRLLSGNSGTIFYPNQYLMKSSDGEWRTDYYIFSAFNSGIDNSYLSTLIKGKTSGFTAYVESIETHYNYNTQEQFLKIGISNRHGTITDDVVIFNNGTTEIEVPIYTTVKRLNIVENGNNYQVDDTLSLANNPTLIARVKAIKSGKIDSYAILNGGSGYLLGQEISVVCNKRDDYSALPRVFVDEIDENGAITSLDIRYPGYGLYEVPSFDDSTTDNGTGAEIEFISYEAGGIAQIEITAAEFGYQDGEILQILSDTGVGATVVVETGKMYTGEPYYYKEGSFLSDVFKLQDSDYWQEYSYEIQSTLTLDGDILTQFSDYKDIFKRLVHPAGFKLFNSFIISNHINLEQVYINSTISLGYQETFIDLVNWIELVSYWNRIIDNQIIFQHRFSTISEESDTQLNYYTRVGGDFVHSTITPHNLEESRYAWRQNDDGVVGPCVYTSDIRPTVGEYVYNGHDQLTTLTVQEVSNGYIICSNGSRYIRSSVWDYTTNPAYDNYMGAILTEANQSWAETEWDGRWRTLANGTHPSTGSAYNTQGDYLGLNLANYEYDGSGYAVFYSDLSRANIAFYVRRFDSATSKVISGPGENVAYVDVPVYAYRPQLGETESAKRVYLLRMYPYPSYLHNNA